MRNRTFEQQAQACPSVWVPGFSRPSVTVESGAKHWVDSVPSRILPAKAGTPYAAPSFGYEISGLGVAARFAMKRTITHGFPFNGALQKLFGYLAFGIFRKLW